MKKRTLIILILLSILANLDLSAKPRKGHYLIRGVMYVNSDSIYRNKLFLINGKEIYTDSLGNFEVKILWESVDKFGAFFWQVRREEKNLIQNILFLKLTIKRKA